MTDVSIPIAFIAGLISFVSPCVLPLIPAYITYITGTAIEEELKNKKFLALSRTLGFILGFSITFIIMGVSVSLVGRIFDQYKGIFTVASGILIIGFGLSMMGILDIGSIIKGTKTKLPKITNWFSSIIVGMTFAAGWTPCISAVLGTILLYAGTSATVSKGFYLLLSYSIGLSIPFILTALLINRFSVFLARSEKVIPYIMKVCGLIIVALGILILFNKTYLIASLFI